jgi:hypothetical protein
MSDHPKSVDQHRACAKGKENDAPRRRYAYAAAMNLAQADFNFRAVALQVWEAHAEEVDRPVPYDPDLQSAPFGRGVALHATIGQHGAFAHHEQVPVAPDAVARLIRRGA